MSVAVFILILNSIFRFFQPSVEVFVNFSVGN